MNIRIAAEFEAYGKKIVDELKNWRKLNGSRISKADVGVLAENIFKNVMPDADGPQNKVVDRLKKELTDGGWLEAVGIRVAADATPIMFASENEALQYLADLTGQRVVIAEDDNDEDDNLQVQVEKLLDVKHSEEEWNVPAAVLKKIVERLSEENEEEEDDDEEK